MSDMPASLQLDDVSLADYLAAHIEGFQGPLRSSKFTGGQSNPTYLLEAASGRYVLRHPGSEGERAYWDYQTAIKECEASLGAPMANGRHWSPRRHAGARL